MAKLYTDKWSLDNIKAVLFDKDGTFINSHIYWGEIIKRRIHAVMQHFEIKEDLFASLCSSLGLDTKTGLLIKEGPIAIFSREVVVTSLINKLKECGVSSNSSTIEEILGNVPVVRIMPNTPALVNAEIFKKVHENFLPDIYNYVKIIEDAKILFDKLKSVEIKLAVVTSDMHANTDAILKHLGLEKYFDLVIGKDDCSKAKKTGEPAKIALKKLNVKAENTISVGDAEMDYLMAKNAGLKGSILVATGQTPLEELLDYTPTSVEKLKEVQVD